MGLISWIWGAPSDAASPRREANPWRRLYDPGSPPNTAAVEGAAYYDNVKVGFS
jgi:hypothetical protein